MVGAQSRHARDAGLGRQVFFRLQKIIFAVVLDLERENAERQGR
jgi:hypothetical protein